MGEDTGSAAGSTKVFKGSFGELDNCVPKKLQGTLSYTMEDACMDLMAVF
jgi:hypothetical protein